MSLTMHAPSALPPLTPFAVPFVTGGLVYTAVSTLARISENSHAAHYGVVFGCSVVALLLPTMVIIHQQTVTALARRDRAAFEAARKVDLGQLQPVRVQAADVPTFLQAVDGWHGRADFAHANPAQTQALARRVVGGNYSLAYNQLRLIDNWSDREIGMFRQELVDRGFAVQQGRNEVALNGTGKRHFQETARQLSPHPGRGWRK
jgi:hypothetical protein